MITFPTGYESVVKTTPEPFVEVHRSLDDRLAEAFRRYERAFQDHTTDLSVARLDLTLLLWESTEQAPDAVRAQAELDAQAIFRETPPLE